MRMSQAIKIAKIEFGAWVENDQLYFPTYHAKAQWEERIRRHDEAIEAEAKRNFEFNGKRWLGVSAGGWRNV